MYGMKCINKDVRIKPNSNAKSVRSVVWRLNAEGEGDGYNGMMNV